MGRLLSRVRAGGGAAWGLPLLLAQPLLLTPVFTAYEVASSAALVRSPATHPDLRAFTVLAVGRAGASLLLSLTAGAALVTVSRWSLPIARTCLGLLAVLSGSAALIPRLMPLSFPTGESTATSVTTSGVGGAVACLGWLLYLSVSSRVRRVYAPPPLSR